jgi:hypothetical protein
VVSNGDIPDRVLTATKFAALCAAIIPAALLLAAPLRISQHLPAAGTAPFYPSDWKRAAPGRAVAAVRALSVLAPSVPRARCLRRRYAALTDHLADAL